jgi:hypothetical protein
MSCTLPPIRNTPGIMEELPTTTTGMFIESMPDSYQIANYNVQPELVLCTPFDLASTFIAKAELVEESTQVVVSKGFKKGDIKIASSHSK